MSEIEVYELEAPEVVSIEYDEQDPFDGAEVISVSGDGPAGGAFLLKVDDLVDVNAPADQPGVLERQADQIVRPVTRTALLAEHVNSPTPHPAYDDAPSFVLLFQNGLV